MMGFSILFRRLQLLEPRLRPRHWLSLALALATTFLVCVLPLTVQAENRPASNKLPQRLLHEPATCIVGVYIQDMRDYKFAERSLYASIRLWSVCPSDRDSPLTDLTVLSSNGIRMGEIHSQKVINKSDYFTNNPEVYWSERTIEGTFFHHWSSTNFPFDRHIVSFEFEALKADSHAFVITPDYAHSGFSPSLNDGDWIAGDFTLSELPHSYSTNFGKPDNKDNANGSYSRIKVSITLRRAHVTTFVKLCVGVYAAVIIAGISFIYNTSQATLVSGRTGLLVGCLFAAIVNMQKADAVLGMSEDVSLTDLIHIISIIYILLASLQTVMSYLRCESGQEELAKRIDRKICLPIYMFSYAVVNIVIIAYSAIIG
jgi:hypothetical protein